MPGLLVTVDYNLKIIQMNEAASKLFNMPKKRRLIGKPVSEIMDDYSLASILAFERNLMQDEIYLENQKCYLDRVMTNDKENKMILCIMKDITKERKHKDQIHNAQIEAARMADKLVEEQLDAFLEQGLLPEKSRSFLQDSREELLLNLNYKTFYQAYLQMAETQIRENVMSDQQRRQCVSDAQKCMEYAQTLQELQEAYLKFCEKLNSAMFGNTAYVSKPVSMAVEYIRRNYKNDISLEDIAEHAQVSSHYICSLFKKEIGMNVSKYVMEYRISKAKTLLMTTNMKSYEVAVETGFANESYFSRSFKKVTGFSPSDFRREICEIQGEI